ncbi:MAG TPA: FKBP-type peptidyl-prolyl cis-trans isomerase [Chitinophagaceae bacterium]|jgi:FKBP-type peptidyl-prolyl cis-trans isomerase FkpA
MRRFNFLLIAVVIGLLCTGGLILAGCLKSNNSSPCTSKAVTVDEPAILAYLATNNITGYVKHSSGLYYKIDSLGSAVSPNSSSKVYVTYTGKFTDNTVFDSVSDASKTGWTLGTLLQGWQIGLPLIGKGGRIHLYIPSALGYGCTITGPIPANSVLVFDITLVDVL